MWRRALCCARRSLIRQCRSQRTQFRSRSITSLVTNSRRCFSSKGDRMLALEHKYGAHNYHPIPVVIARGKGAEVWDIDGKQYLDFLAAYSAVNQGHCHPKIVESLKQQCETLTLTSRAFHNDLLGDYCEYITQYFGYDRVLPMNTGVEACESAVKIARRWSYENKGVTENQATVVFARNNFWGRSIAAVSSSTDPTAFSNYGPYVPNFFTVEYNNISEMTRVIRENKDTLSAVMLEPIQGEAGVIIPDDSYLQKVRELCDENNCLLIIDEVQTGLGRCGAETCGAGVFGVRADLVTLGKALSGGVFPVSAVVGTEETIGVLTPGSHGSTYGGNPLACRVAKTALEVLRDENLCDQSAKLGKYLLDKLKDLQTEFDLVTTVRGQGLFCAMEIETDESKGVSAWEVCLKMAENGVLAKPTHGHIIRLSPPLVITEAQLDYAVDAIRKSLVEISKRRG